MLDLKELRMMRFHYGVIEATFKGQSDLMYSDTDSLVYDMQHPDVNEWLNENREHFELSDSKRADMRDYTNKEIECYEELSNDVCLQHDVSVSPRC